MFHFGLFRSGKQSAKPGEKITGRPQKAKNGYKEYIIEEGETYPGKTGK